MDPSTDFGFFTPDMIHRSAGDGGATGLSPALRRKLLADADAEVRAWLGIIGLQTRAAAAGPADISALDVLIEKAQRLDLFSQGGVPRRNFVALALVGHYLHPRLYLESGYYKGSSIFASFLNKALERVVGFDPHPGNYRVGRPPEGVEVDLRQSDFRTFEDLPCPPEDALAYFDDHMNAAVRVLQSAEKGLRHIIFDDCCGVNGTCQRLWPAMPSLFFIRRHREITPGETMTWEYRPERSLGSIARRVLRRRRPTRLGGGSLRGKVGATRLEFHFDEDVLDLCRRADERIEAVHKIPDLSDFVFETAHRGVETTQHFVVLKGS